MIVYKVIDWTFDTKRFGYDVAEQRKRARLTLRALGDMIGRSDSHIKQIEKAGNPETVALADVMKLCNLFDLDPRDYLALGGQSLASAE